MTWLSDAAVEHLRDVADWPMLPTDRYEIVEPLARGGMGTVYRGHDRDLDRAVAIKVLSPIALSEEASARMQQEARILARLEHPGVVPVYDLGRLTDGRIFYVMRLVHGRRLDEYVEYIDHAAHAERAAHTAARGLSEKLRLFVRICDPVAFAHAQGVIHRDLKPDNVMVGPFGEVLVMDWGIAALGGESALGGEAGLAPSPAAGAVVGTRAYMPPEQTRGDPVDARADVFALGSLLYFMLTGAAPLDEGIAPPGERIAPRPLLAICAKARAVNRDDRYPDVLSLAADVNRFLSGDSVTARRETALERLARFVRNNRIAVVIVLVYLVLRVVIAWLAP
jgi:serine/threonine protein kinase